MSDNTVDLGARIVISADVGSTQVAEIASQVRDPRVGMAWSIRGGINSPFDRLLVLTLRYERAHTTLGAKPAVFRLKSRNEHMRCRCDSAV